MSKIWHAMLKSLDGSSIREKGFDASLASMTIPELEERTDERLEDHLRGWYRDPKGDKMIRA